MIISRRRLIAGGALGGAALLAGLALGACTNDAGNTRLSEMQQIAGQVFRGAPPPAPGRSARSPCRDTAISAASSLMVASQALPPAEAARCTSTPCSRAGS